MYALHSHTHLPVLNIQHECIKIFAFCDTNRPGAQLREQFMNEYILVIYSIFLRLTVLLVAKKKHTLSWTKTYILV